MAYKTAGKKFLRGRRAKLGELVQLDGFCRASDVDEEARFEPTHKSTSLRIMYIM